MNANALKSSTCFNGIATSWEQSKLCCSCRERFNILHTKPSAPLGDEVAERTVSALGDGDCDEVGETLSQGNVFPEGRGDPDGIAAGNSPNQPGVGASGVGM